MRRAAAIDKHGVNLQFLFHVASQISAAEVGREIDTCIYRPAVVKGRGRSEREHVVTFARTRAEEIRELKIEKLASKIECV